MAGCGTHVAPSAGEMDMLACDTHLTMNRSPRPWSKISSGGLRLSEHARTMAFGAWPLESCGTTAISVMHRDE